MLAIRPHNELIGSGYGCGPKTSTVPGTVPARHPTEAIRCGNRKPPTPTQISILGRPSGMPIDLLRVILGLFIWHGGCTLHPANEGKPKRE
jgi:hypothetical protein